MRWLRSKPIRTVPRVRLPSISVMRLGVEVALLVECAAAEAADRADARIPDRLPAPCLVDEFGREPGAFVGDGHEASPSGSMTMPEKPPKALVPATSGQGRRGTPSAEALPFRCRRAQTSGCGRAVISIAWTSTGDESRQGVGQVRRVAGRGRAQNRRGQDRRRRSQPPEPDEPGAIRRYAAIEPRHRMHPSCAALIASSWLAYPLIRSKLAKIGLHRS